MNFEKTLFAQFFKFLLIYDFRQCVQRYQCIYRVQTLVSLETTDLALPLVGHPVENIALSSVARGRSGDCSWAQNLPENRQRSFRFSALLRSSQEVVELFFRLPPTHPENNLRKKLLDRSVFSKPRHKGLFSHSKRPASMWGLPYQVWLLPFFPINYFYRFYRLFTERRINSIAAS
jgi:hypothetical protein